MPNLVLPPGAQQSDVVAALLMAVYAALLSPPVPTVTPTGGASGNYTYVVSANVNGIILPSAPTAITTGPTTLSAAAYNTLTWAPINVPQLQGSNFTVTYNIYRTSGGTNQGLVGSVTWTPNAMIGAATGPSTVNPTLPTFVDNGIAANTAMPAPPFNTSGLFFSGEQRPVLSLVGTVDAITIPSGLVIINNATILDAVTLAAPIAGPASAGGHDGCQLTIWSNQAKVNTVTTPANGVNGNKHIITFTAGTVGLFAMLEAFNGTWLVTNNNGATIS